MAVYRCTGDLHVLPRTYGRVRAFVDCAGDGNSQGVRYRCEPCLYGGRPLGTSKVHAAPISQVVVPIAEERGLKIMQIEPMPFIIDALWTSRKYADENPQVVQNVVRAYTRAIAVLVKDREKSLETLRKYMRTSDPRVVQNGYERYKEELDRVPIPSEKAIKNTLEISQRVAPKLAGIDIKRYLYFAPVQRLAEEGFIDRLYK
jgi:hypothetical protein